MDSADAFFFDCIVFAACGGGGLALGVALAHRVPRRFVADLWPPDPPEFLGWRHLLPTPSLPPEELEPGAWPPAHGAAPPGPPDPLGLLLGGLVLLGFLGAVCGGARKEPES